MTETTKTFEGKEVKVSYKLNEDGTVSGANGKTAGGVSVIEGKTTTLAFENDYKVITKVTVSKQDVAGEEIEGAKIQIKDKDGNVVEEWISGSDGKDENNKLKPHVIEGKLNAGEEYTLHEETAPDGYNTVSDFTFKVGEDNKVELIGATTDGEVEVAEDGTLVVTDSRKETPGTKVTVSKQDVAGEEIEGAQIQILDKDGNVVEEWTSGDDGKDENGKVKPHVIEGKLNAGEEYTLHEEAGPAGYTTVTDIKFIIDNDNKVELKGASTDGDVRVDEDGNVVITDSKTKVTVSKQDVAGEEIEGAKIQIKDKEGNVVEEWTSGSDGKDENGKLKPHVIEGKLNAGEEYTLHEETAPDGYNTVSDFTFKVGEDNKVELIGATTDGEVEVAEDGTIIVTDSKKEVTEEKGNLIITKTFGGDVTKEEIEEGAITITVRKVDKDGKVIGYLNKDGKLVSEETALTLGEADGFEVSEDGKTYKKTFEGIGLGKYVVEEKNSTIPGYSLTSESTTTAEGTVTKNGTAEAGLNDEYKKVEIPEEKGKLVITKTIDGDNITESEFERALKFTVQNSKGKYLDKNGNLSDEKVELTLKDGGFIKGADGKYTKTFYSVAAGKYTVTETNSDVEGYDLVADKSTTESRAEVKADETATAELKDVYEKIITGSLVITKTVEGIDETNPEYENAYTFEVKTPDGKWLDKDGKISETEVKLTLKDGGFEKREDGTYVKIFENVKPGKYIVVETSTEVSGYDLVTEKSTTEGEVEVVPGETAQFDLEEVYVESVPTAGKLVITKTVDGLTITESEFEGALTFEVKTEDGKWLDKAGKVSDSEQILTLKDFTKGEDGIYTKTFKDVAAGKYTVVEKNVDVEGYNFIQEKSTTDGTATVEDGKEAAIELKDVYEEQTTPEKKGDLIIRKTIGGEVTEEEIEKAALKFEVKTSDGKWLDKDGKISDEKVELTLGEADGFVTTDGGKTWTKTFKDVPADTYTVTETNSLIDGYDLKDTSKTDAKAEVKDGEAATAEITNEYDKEASSEENGRLVITKTIDGDNITESEFEGALTFEVKTEDGKWLDKDGNISETEVKLTLKDGGFVKGEDGTYTKTFENVAPGKYTVTETNSDVEGYKLVADKSVTEGNATVEAGKTTTIELKDVYEKTEENPTTEDEKKDDEKSGPNDTNPDDNTKKDNNKTDKKTPSSTVRGGSSSGGGSGKSSGGSKSRGSVGTGDDTDVATPAITAIIALGAILVLLRKRRNQNME